MKYREKATEIEAVQMPTRDGDFALSPFWLREALGRGHIKYTSETEFTVHETYRVVNGAAGDYIVCSGLGELRWHHKRAFERQYEAIR